MKPGASFMNAMFPNPKFVTKAKQNLLMLKQISFILTTKKLSVFGVNSLCEIHV